MPDKKSLWDELPVIDEASKKDPSSKTSLWDELPIIEDKNGVPSQGVSGMDAKGNEISIKPGSPLSMQTVNDGRPSQQVHDALSHIQNNFSQYIGKIPDGPNVVTFQGKSEAGNPVERVYANAPGKRVTVVEKRTQEPVNLDKYRTKLTPEEESGFEKWRATLPQRLQSEDDYDLKGFYKENPNFNLTDPEQHLTDKFKLPNHETFSNESKYFNDQTKKYAGYWDGDNYMPYNAVAKKALASNIDNSPATNLSYTPNAQKPITKEEQTIAQGEVRKELQANTDFITKDIADQFDNQPDFIKTDISRLGMDKDKIAEKITNPTGDKEALKAYAQTRMETLQQQYQNEIAAIPKPQMPSTGPMNVNDERAYNQQVAQVEKKYKEKNEAINNAVFNIAAQKVVNEQIAKGTDPAHLNPYDIGAEVEKIAGDEKDVQADQDRWSKYGKFDPTKKVNREIVGYRAMQVAQMQALATGNTVLAGQLDEKTKDFQRKIIDNNPDFRKQQLVKLLSDEIYKNQSSLYTTITGYRPNEEELKSAATKLGIPEKDIQDIKPDDLYGLPYGHAAVTPLNTFIKNSFLPAVEGGIRHVVNPLHQIISPSTAPSDEDLNESLNASWYDNSTVGLLMGGKAPMASNMAGSGTRVENNPTATNYLMDVSDDHKNWNINLGSIANAAYDGIGQIYAAGYLGTKFGEAFKAAQIVNDIHMADRVGLFAYNFLSGYDRNKKQANQAIGRDGSEMDKIGLATLYTGVESFSEQMFPETELGHQIFGTEAGQALIHKIKTEGIKSITKPTLVNSVIKASKEIVKNDIKEGLEESINVYGNAVGDYFFAPKQFASTNYNQQAIQQGVMGAVSALIPVGTGAISQVRQQGSVMKSAMYHVGENPTLYRQQVQDDMGAGKLTQKEADEKLLTIDKLAQIVNNEVPATSVINDKPLSLKDKNDYASNLLQQSLLTDKVDNTKDEVQKGIIEKQIEGLKEERTHILEHPGGQDISSPINTNQDGQINQAEEARKGQENEDVLATPASSVQETAPASPYADLQWEKETNVEPQNTEENATKETIQQQQESGTAGSVIEHQGTESQRNETALPEANSSNSDQRIEEGQKVIENKAPSITPVKSILPEDYVTSSGNQKVTYENGALRVVNAKTNEGISAATAKKAILEAAQNYDFLQGETVGDKISVGISKNDEYIAENSNSPRELADLYTNAEPVEQSLSGPEFAISQFGGFTTTNKSYNRFGDRNNMSRHKAVNYVNNEKGAGIDQIAQEISNHSGIDIQPQDIVDFMDRFPNGIKQSQRTDISPVAEKAAQRFQEITGFPLTPAITDEIYKQQSNSDFKFANGIIDDEATKKLINNGYESDLEVDRAYWDELAQALLNNEEEAGIVQSFRRTGQDAVGANEEQSANTTGTGGAIQEAGGSPQQAAEVVGSQYGPQPLNEADQKLSDLRDTIEDYKKKLEKSAESRDLMYKQGKEDTPEYKGKVQAAQQLTKKLKEAQREYEKLAAKAWADNLRSKKIATATDENSFVERNDIPQQEVNHSIKSEYYQQLEEALDEVKNARRDVTRKNRLKDKTSKNVDAFTRKLISGVNESDVTESKATLTDAVKNYREDKRMLRASLPRERGGNFLIEKLSNAVRNGYISQEGADLAIDLVRTNPDIFSDLAISVSKNSGDETSQGQYNSGDRLVKIAKGSEPITATHELLHHTERYLPEDIRVGILNEWHNNVEDKKAQLRKELQSANSPEQWNGKYKALLYLEMAQKMQAEPSHTNRQYLSKEMMEMLKDLKVDAYYQYFNPSEWWAVNASKQFSEKQTKPQGWIEQAKQWYQKLLQSIKNVLGLNNTQAVSKGLSTVLKGENLDKMSGTQLSGNGLLYHVKNEVGLNAQVYNGALEKAARLLENGTNLKTAIEEAIDFIKDRVHGTWDENKMRNDILGENMAVPLNADEIRARKVSDGQLSEKQKQNADVIVDAIKNNKSTLTEAEQYINTHKDLSPATKERVINYLRSTVSRDVFKANGLMNAQKYIDDANGDYNEALKQLQLDYTTQSLNITDEKEKENARRQYAANKTAIETAQVTAEVKNGTIKPISAIRTTGPVQEGGFTMPEQKTSEKRRQELVNKFERLEQAQKNSTVPITEELNAVNAYRLMDGKAAKKIDDIKEYLGDTGKHKGSFFDRLDKSGLDIQKFALYLYAKHAPERNARNAQQRQDIFDARLGELNDRLSNATSAEQMAEIESEINKIKQQKDPDYILMPDGGSGMTNEQSKEILDEIEKSGETDKYEKFGQEFKDNVIDKILEFKHESRLLKDQEYEDLSSTYSNYVPLKFDLDEELGSDGKPSLAQTGKSGRDLFRSTGASEVGYDSRNNVILQTISDLQYSIHKGENNLANIRMANLIEANPNPDIWNTVPARYNILHDKNGNVISAREIEKPQGKAVIPYWVDGNKRYIVLNDKGLQETFKRINPTIAMKFLQGVTKWQRTYSTMKNVPFIIINPIKDMSDAWIYAKGNENPALSLAFKKNAPSFFSAAKGVLTGKGEWGALRDEWENIGGKMSFSHKETLEEKGRKSIKNFEAYKKGFSKEKLMGNYKAMKNMVNDYTEVLEQTTRLVMYKSALEAGFTKEEAAIHSREATIDFAKSGTVGPYINAWKAFANAGIQGLNKDILLSKSKKVRKIFLGTVAFGMAQAFFSDMLGDCDEHPETCYWEMPEYRKIGNMVIPTGKGSPVTIPMSRTLGWFNYMGQNIYGAMKYATTNGKLGTSPADFAANSITSLFDYYNPAGGSEPIEQMPFGNAAPAIGYLENKNSFGTPIKPDNKKEVPESENYFPKTPEAYKEISHFLAAHSGGGNGEEGFIEWSPSTLDYFMQSVFSGTYGWMKGIATTASKASNPDDKVEAKDVPLFNRFYRESNLSGTKKKMQGLVDYASKHELTDEESTKLQSYIDRLKANGEMTDDREASTWKFVEKQQHQIRKRKDEYADKENKNSE